jgi:hypothetical protein
MMNISCKNAHLQAASTATMLMLVAAAPCPLHAAAHAQACGTPQ